MARKVRILRGPYEGRVGTIIEDDGKDLPASFFVKFGDLLTFTAPISMADAILDVAEE